MEDNQREKVEIIEEDIEIKNLLNLIFYYKNEIKL